MGLTKIFEVVNFIVMENMPTNNAAQALSPENKKSNFFNSNIMIIGVIVLILVFSIGAIMLNLPQNDTALKNTPKNPVASPTQFPTSSDPEIQSLEKSLSNLDASINSIDQSLNDKPADLSQ